MSNVEDRKAVVVDADEIAQKTKRALASIEREKQRRERNGAMVGIAAGGFGRATSDGFWRLFVKVSPAILMLSFTIGIVYYW